MHTPTATGLIRAFNNDLPWRDFIKLQIAADCENDTYFHLPVDEPVALKIEPDKSTATPDTFDLVAEDDLSTIETDKTLTKVTWHGTSADTAENTENTIQWKFGPDELEIPLPIR
jgi:hypothetical protein